MLLGVAVSRGYFDVVWKVFSPLEGVIYLFIIIKSLSSTRCHILTSWCQHHRDYYPPPPPEAKKKTFSQSMCHILTLPQPSPTPCRGNFIDVNILSHYHVLMSISCHNFKSWCQQLVTLSSNILKSDVDILSHSQVSYQHHHDHCHCHHCKLRNLLTHVEPSRAHLCQRKRSGRCSYE